MISLFPELRFHRTRIFNLLQHVHNPIDWYPWGEEAFAKAREENKPIFFSCGYSTCHCFHVVKMRKLHIYIIKAKNSLMLEFFAYFDSNLF
ncbi:DUF255 domain-containing protein [Sporomusa rhizae]|uniref:DUF255 domain-containing protein n=1 Tax=Sporomusa rhizae TaxID=357999 RepID=UPI003529EECB